MSQSPVKAAHAATRQAMAATRLALIAEAQTIADRAGSKAILVTRLANKHGVSGLTAKRWLEQAGFELNESLKGRPTHHAVLVHDGLI